MQNTPPSITYHGDLHSQARLHVDAAARELLGGLAGSREIMEHRLAALGHTAVEPVHGWAVLMHECVQDGWQW